MTVLTGGCQRISLIKLAAYDNRNNYYNLLKKRRIATVYSTVHCLKISKNVDQSRNYCGVNRANAEHHSRGLN